MKIVNFEVFFLHGDAAPGPRTGPFIFVKLVSDDGVVGWGQAAHHGAELTASAVATMGRWLTELDSVTIEGVWQQFFRRGYRKGNTGAQLAALAAIDIALHDLVGHALGVPVASLLGGRIRDRVPVYASFMGPPLEPARELERVAASLERGFTAVKLHAGAPRHAEDGPSTTVEVVEALRGVWPSRGQLQIIIDVSSSFTVHEAIRIGRRLEELDVWWLEEPIPSHDLIGYKKVQEALDLPVAAGEGESNLSQFRELILEAGLDILQPNLTTCGGFTLGKKIAALAEAFNRPIACHNIDPTLMTAANLQFAAWARTATLPQEYFSLDDDHLLRDATPILSKAIVPKDGFVELPDDPGLGIVVDEARMRSLAVVTSA